jgi:hypothetical protein
VSYYGVGHAMGNLSEDEISHLARIARRLAPDPKERLRVSIAVAVREAVLLMDPASHQQATAMLLWLDLEDPDFEEDKSRKRRPLHERHPAVAAMLGRKLSGYERHKGWRPLYERVATNLLALVDRANAAAPYQQHRTFTDESINESSDKTREHLTQLAEAATDLYFAALTSLFVADFHNRRIQDRLQVSSLYDWADAAQWLLCCYARSFTRYQTNRSSLPAQTNERLGWLAKLGEENDPFVGRREHIALLTFGYELEHGRKDGSSAIWLESAEGHIRERIQGLQANGIDMGWALSMLEKTPRPKGDALRERWIAWYQTQFNCTWTRWPPQVDQAIPNDYLTPHAIEILAAIGECYLQAVTAEIDLGRPILTHARQRAHRMIGSFYDIDDWRPLGLGGSLRDYVDHFFDNANKPLSCQNRRNMLQLDNMTRS